MKRTKPTNTTAAATAALVALAIVAMTPTGATASKEKFQRTKPHVNIGPPRTLQTGQSIRVAVGLLNPAVQAGLASGPTSADVCSATVDLRIVDAADPEGTPLAERRDVSLDTSGIEVLDYTPATGNPVSVFTTITGRDMNVDGKSCVLRGNIEVSSSADGTVNVEQNVFRQDFGPVRAKR
jgi:hypothetical protein